MRTSRMRRGLAAMAAAGAALALPAGALAAKPVTFKGRTSQHKAITVQYVRTGADSGAIRFRTTVVGDCPVQGLGTTQMKTRVADMARGGWPVPSGWGWETAQPSYDIKFAGKGRRSLKGKLQVSWQTNIDNAPTCQTTVLRWKARRKK